MRFAGRRPNDTYKKQQAGARLPARMPGPVRTRNPAPCSHRLAVNASLLLIAYPLSWITCRLAAGWRVCVWGYVGEL